jgi:hypothetical protein
MNKELIDRITEPQEWIDGLLKIYAPNSEDIDVALQNMGLEINRLNICQQDFLKRALEIIDNKPEWKMGRNPNNTFITKGGLIEALKAEFEQ